MTIRTSGPSRRQLGLGLAGLTLSQALPCAAQSQTTSMRAVHALDGGGLRPGVSAQPDGVLGLRDEALLATSRPFGHRAIAVWHDGRLVYENYADGEGPDTLFAGFSMAKSVLALMVGIALDRGVFGDLDDPVGLYLPQWSGDARGTITLRQLLQMRSGLHLYSLAASDPQALAMVSGPHATQTALATPLAEQPDARFKYANVNSQILGVALANALKSSGQGDYGTALNAWLWQPLGLGQAELELEAIGGHPRYFAGLSASVRDWGALAAMIASNGRVGQTQVVPAWWLDQMAQPSAHAPYGLHIWRAQAWQPRRYYGSEDGPFVPTSQPIAAPDMLIMDGAGGQRAYVSRQQRLAIVRFGHPSWEWEDSALPNAVLAALA